MIFGDFCGTIVLHYRHLLSAIIQNKKVREGTPPPKRDKGAVPPSMIFLEKNRDTEEQLNIFSQYFQAMESLSTESLYIVDILSKELRCQGIATDELGLPAYLPGYPECVYDWAHPDQLEAFQEFSFASLAGNNGKIELQIKNCDGSYQWYELSSMIIRGENREAIEILGKIKNIQEEHKLEEDNAFLNQYFAAMQEISDDVLFRIDVQTMTLHRLADHNKTDELGENIPSFMSVLSNQNLIHPEDAEKYERYAKEWFAGEREDCALRFMVAPGYYEWFTVKAKKILDEQGNLKEVFGKLVNIQKQEELKADLSTTHQYLAAMQELSEDILYRIDGKTGTLYHSYHGSRLEKFKNGIPDHLNTIVKEEIVHPEDAESYLQQVEEWDRGEREEIKARFSMDGDAYNWYSIRSIKIHDEKGELVEIYAKMSYIQDKVEMQKEYSALNQYFSAMQQLSKDILFHIDIPTQTMYHSDHNAQSFGVPIEIPHYIEVFIQQGFIRPEDAENYRKYNKKLLSGENMGYQIQAAVGVGVYEWFDVKSKFIYNEKGEPSEIFGTMENIQWKKDLEQRATQDLMTKVLNKASFEGEVATILEDSSHSKQHALIFIDLDDFKGINDTLGHSFGDSLLSTVGKRLKRVVRKSDLVGRIGGDEFAVFLQNIDSEASAVARTNLLLETLQRKFSFEGNSKEIHSSMGISIFPKHGTDYKELIGKSDLALYQSKRNGKNLVTLYAEDYES